MKNESFKWWQEGIIYQIYPRSFADSNGDGFGDIPGITSRLDYLADLGVDAVWLSPIYPSPDADFGYDVADHIAIDHRYGSMEDFDKFCSRAHKLGIRVILDMVMNHTSDQHEWFKESRSSINHPKRNWFIWMNPTEKGGVPNNWQSSFGGSAWEYDNQSGQYYLHSFLKEQPDVNWRNPDLRKAQLDVFRFWLEKGVDGFRLDVFNAYFKDAKFRNNPGKFGLRSFDRQEHLYDINQPEMMDFLNEFRALLDEYPDRYAVGETYVTSIQNTIQYTGKDKLHTAFSFDYFGSEISFPWNAEFIKERTALRDSLFAENEVYPTTVFSNHDKPRAAGRTANKWRNKGEDDYQALLAMTLLLTLKGTPFMYYGEEIGMRDIQLGRSEIMDPPGKKYWPVYKGRDGCRSPMQWDETEYAGFSNHKPWLKIHPDYLHRNVNSQKKDPGSIYNFTKKLISIRRTKDALRRGTYRCFYRSDTGVLAYERKYIFGEISQRIIIYLNFSGSTRTAGFVRDADSENAHILLSSVNRKEFYTSHHQFLLNPHEVLLLEIESDTEFNEN